VGWVAGFQNADAGALAGFYANGAFVSGHSIRAAGSVVEGERIEGPIRIGEHVNASVLADQDGHIRTGFPFGCSGFGCVQDGLGLFGKAHKPLIAENRPDSSRIEERRRGRCGWLGGREGNSRGERR